MILNVTAAVASSLGLLVVCLYGIHGAHGRSYLLLTLGIISWFTGLVILSRKLIENLIIDVLRKKYPPDKIRNLNLYYDKNKRRFHDFTVLLDNLEKRKRKFQIDEPTVSKFISLAKPFRFYANSKAHSMIEVSNKKEIIDYKIADMVGLLMRLK